VADKTLFSKIIDREISADIVFEDDICLAFRDIAPTAPVHILIVPKRPIAQVAHLTDADTNLAGHLVLVATQIARREGLEDGYRLVFNNGKEGGQTVFHIHLHLIGGRPMTWPPG
jgi:histidine triad (HIT) family protein